jgi:hypothetical protein
MRRLLGIVLLVSSFGTSAFAADRVIQNGIDVWMTKGDGSTFVDFAKNPIPAGFFCPSSAPFTGKVAFQGVPIVTGTPGALGRADTIVQRLDDAAFDKRGVATTRVQVRALSLKSIEPINTACGKFDLSVRLDGTQPTTRMRILRDDENGGRFSAPLSLNTKVSFTPVGRAGGETLEMAVPVRFAATPNVPWHSKAAAPTPAGFVLVDTDGDRSPDTYLPGTSNFVAGQASRPALHQKPGLAVGAYTEGGGQYYCHSGDGHEHCYWLCNGCQIP